MSYPKYGVLSMRRKTTLFKLLIIVFIPLISLSVGLFIFSYYVSQKVVNLYILEVVRTRLGFFPKLISNMPQSLLKDRIEGIEKMLGIKVKILLVRDSKGETTVLYGDPENVPNIFISNPNERKSFTIGKINFEAIPVKPPNFPLIGTKRLVSNRPTHFIIGYTITKGPSEIRFIRLMLILFSIPLGISMMLGIFLSYIFYLRLNEGVKNIVKVTKEIINGNYDVNVEPQEYTSELYELSKALNVLKLSLKEQKRVREKISSEISHSLRTPLTSMRMNLEAMMDGVIKPDENRLKKLLENLDKLSKMVEAVKKLSEIRMDENKKVIFNLSNLIKGVCKSMMDSFKAKGLNLIVDIDENIEFYGDPDKIEMAFRNVLDNSLKYTDEGKVTVTLRKKKDGVSLKVSDTGRGIPEDDIPHITDRFYRVHNDVEGMGIGLSIVKEVIEFHGGELKIRSSTDRGTTVEMIFKNSESWKG